MEGPVNRLCSRCQRYHDDALPCRTDDGPQTNLFDGSPDPTPFERGMHGSALAGYKWTVLEKARIDEAIVRCARELEEFTADDVWERAPSVPVTKGLAGRLNAANHRGLIESTGRVAFAARGGEHDHRQRLAVWRSLVWRSG
jgi:hypothetical protein